MQIIPAKRIAGIIMRRHKKQLGLLAVILISILTVNGLILYYGFGISPIDISCVLGMKYKSGASYPDSDSKKAAEVLAEKGTGGYGTDQTDGDSMDNTALGTACESDIGAYGRDDCINGDGSSLYITENELEFLYSMGLIDKLKVMSILSGLGSDELNRIIDISKDGVTSEEYSEIESIAQRELSAEDVETLRNIIEKYKVLYAQED